MHSTVESILKNSRRPENAESVPFHCEITVSNHRLDWARLMTVGNLLDGGLCNPKPEQLRPEPN